MELSITDGTGTGQEAKVDETNRLEVRAVTEDGAVEALAEGGHFAITSGEITLTSANSSAMMWFKNNEKYPMIIDRIILNSVDSTGGTEPKFKVIMYKNPTGMTGGTSVDVTQVNTNFGSNEVIDLLSEKGQEAATIDGGGIIGGWQIENPTYMKVINTRLLLPKGASIGWAIVPPASNTSLPVTLAVNAHIAKHDL